MITQATRLTAHPCSFSRRVRITERRDFERSRAEGRRATGSGLALEVTRTEGPTRLGLVVSRRVGGAVVRNRVKRRIREWFRRRRADLPPGRDLVVIARIRAATYSLADVSAELDALVARQRS